MSANISGVGKLQNQVVQGQEDEAEVMREQGDWNGMAVSVNDDPSSLIADAAEEMTFAAEEETEEKDVSERKTHERDKKHHHANMVVVVPPVKEMQQFRNQLAERLAELMAKIRRSMGNPAAFRQALEGFSNPTERHVALLWLEEQFKDQPSLAEMARREREKLEAEQPSAVQAGYNLMGLDGDLQAGAGPALYRRTILGHESVSALLESIIEKGGEGDFHSRVEYLIKAVGRDLSSTNPSTDKNELEMLNNDLFHLRALANFTRQFADDVGKLREESSLSGLPRAGVETLRLLCRVKDERIVIVEGLNSILSLQGDRNPTYDVKVLTQAYKLAHSLPAKLFVDNDSRQRVLEAVQGRLDKAVDIEESLLSEGD